MITVEQIQSLDKTSLDKMTSESYKEAFNDPTIGEAFRKRIDFIENSPKPAPTPRSNGRVRADEPAASTSSFDPSFDDSPNLPAEAPAPVAGVEPVSAATEDELPILEHRYWPTDRNGKKIGGEQVFKYRTQQELITKLTAAHMASSARIRELSRDRKLDELASGGTPTKVPVPSNEVPETIEELATELRQVRESNYFLAVRAAIADFTASAGWNKYRSKENAESIVLAVTKAGDDPTDVASYHRAFSAMKAFIEEVNPNPVAEQPKAAVAAPAPAVRAANTPRLATGLSSQDGEEDYTPAAPLNAQPSVGIVVNGVRITSIAQWDRLSSDAQKRVLRNPSFATVVNRMYDDQAAQQRAARSGR
jgi:hypothetical protein